MSRMLVLDFTGSGEVLRQMLVSISIAIVSMFTGMVVSFILSFLAAENITPNRIVSLVIKSIVAVVRAVPGLV
jgi:phosphonate transport system permease protein